MPVSIKVKPDMRLVRAKFKHMTDEMNNPQTAMKSIGLRGFKDITDHFNRSESPSGKWKPLKSRKGKPLMDTGRLRMAFSFRYMKRAVELIKDVKYAIYHNKSKSNQGIAPNIPKREFMWISEPVKKTMTKILLSSIMRSYK